MTRVDPKAVFIFPALFDGQFCPLVHNFSSRLTTLIYDLPTNLLHAGSLKLLILNNFWVYPLLTTPGAILL